jgi:hypothetical protein
MWHNEAVIGTIERMAPQPIQDVALATGVSLRQLYRWIAAERIAKYEKIGDRRTFVDPDEVRSVRGGFKRVSGPPVLPVE